jgi:hypothetical protein
MNLNENAAMPYNPGDDEQTGAAGIQVALAKAERQLTHRKGVKGMGMAKTPSGQDAIVVYVQNEQTLSQLPSEVDGVPVIGEVTGEIRAL